MRVNEAFGFDIMYLYDSAQELGGTIREVACDGGLLQAVDYCKLQIDPTLAGKVLQEEDITYVEDDGSYELWEKDCSYIADGDNCGWLFDTQMFGKQLVKPDIYVVKLAMKVYYAEQIIRRTIDPHFFAERADFEDEILWDEISKHVLQALSEHWLRGFLHGTLPVSYRILAYQVCYIHFHYPQVYEEVWSKSYYPPYLDEDLPFDNKESAVMGIAMGEHQSMVSYDEYLQKPMEVYGDYVGADNLRMYHAGSGNLKNAGVACSKMAVAFRDIVQSYYRRRVPEISHINACYIGDVPTAQKIEEYMKQFRGPEFSYQKKPEAIDKNLFVYEELGLEKMNGESLIYKAAEMAKLPDFYLCKSLLLPIVEYYATGQKKGLENGESAFVFYLDEYGFKTGLVSRINGEYVIQKESEYNKQIVQEFDQRVYEEMVKLIQPKLDIFNISYEDEDVLALKEDVPRMKRQFIRNDSGAVIFNNGWFSHSAKFSHKIYQDCVDEFMEKCDKVLEELVGEDDRKIAKLYLAGNMADCPMIWEAIEDSKVLGRAKSMEISGNLRNVVSDGLCMLKVDDSL